MKIILYPMLLSPFFGIFLSWYLLASDHTFQSQSKEVQEFIADSGDRSFYVGEFSAAACIIAAYLLYGKDKNESINVKFTEKGVIPLTPSQKRAVAENLIAAADKEEAMSAFGDEWDNLGK